VAQNSVCKWPPRNHRCGKRIRDGECSHSGGSLSFISVAFEIALRRGASRTATVFVQNNRHENLRTFLAIPLPEPTRSRHPDGSMKLKGVLPEKIPAPASRRRTVSGKKRRRSKSHDAKPDNQDPPPQTTKRRPVGLNGFPTTNLHLTLKFLGEVENVEIHRNLQKYASEVCRSFRSFDCVCRLRIPNPTRSGRGCSRPGRGPDRTRSTTDRPGTRRPIRRPRFQQNAESRDYVPHLTLGGPQRQPTVSHRDYPTAGKQIRTRSARRE